MRRFLPIIILALAVVGIASLFAVYFFPARSPSEIVGLKVHFIDVGQGDCALIQTPDGRNVLVDAGDPDSADDVVKYLLRQRVERIDLLVMTHPHLDHLGGVPRVLEKFGVSRVVDAGIPHGSKHYATVLEMIGRRGIDYSLAAEEQGIQVGDLSIEVIWPIPDTEGRSSDLNDSSVVLRAEFGTVSFFLAADISVRAEGVLLANRQDFPSTVLKVAHHGSADSTSNEFLQIVQPEYAVVSAGFDNPYGHPARSTLKRLNASGAEVLRTDQKGSIVFTTDGTLVHVRTER